MKLAKSIHATLQKMARRFLAIFLISGLVLSIALFSTAPSFASFPIDGPSVIYTIDFAAFTGTGFSPDPTPGQLDSDTWRLSGMSDGDLDFGDIALSGDYAQGQSTGDVGPSGIYAFEVSPGVVVFGVKPSNADFTPGEIVLRIQNNTADLITDLEIGYDLWVNNNQPYATAWSFHHSPDDLSYEHVTAGDYTSAETADGLGWQKYTLTVDITGLAIEHGDFYYLKWASDDVSGHGQRDEFGLDTITIMATVTDVNYAPDAIDDSGSTIEDVSVTIDVLSNDTDPDDDTISLATFTQPSHGSVVSDENGTPLDSSDDRLTYAPDLNWSGEDSFNYTVDDGFGETDTATVTVNVAAVNDPPQAFDDSATTSQDTPVTVDVLLNDTDPELDSIGLDSFTQPSNGVVTRYDNGTPGDTTDDQLTYTPTGGWSGADLFTYTINDGYGETDTANVSVTVDTAYPYVIYFPLVAR